MSYKTARELVSNFEQKRLAKYAMQYEGLLSSMSPSVRSQAINGLIKFQINSDKVKRLLEDPNPMVRRTAIKYYREVGVSDDYVNIVPLLDDPEEKVVEEAVQAIYWLTSEYDLKRFLTDNSPKIRYATLKTMEEEIEDEQLSPLTEDLNLRIRNLAWTIKINRTNDIELLKKTVSDSQEFSLIKAAMKKLLVYDAAFCYEKLKLFLNDDKAFTLKQRQSFLSLIKELPLDIAETIVNEQVEKIKDEALMKKLILPYVSLNSDSPAKVIATLNSLVNDEDPEIRVQVLKGYTKLNETSTVQTIRSMIDDPDEKVRAACIMAMTKLLDYYLVEIIDKLVIDYSKYVRKAAIKAIGRLKIEDSYNHIVEAIKNYKEDDSVRKEAMNIASRLKLSNALDVLVETINNELEEFNITNNAVRALLRISPEKVIELLG